MDPWIFVAALAFAFALACRAARKGIERAYAEGRRDGQSGQDTPPPAS
jgi:hypothetical protein